MMEGLMLLWYCLCLLLHVPETGGQVTQLPQRPDNGAILNRLSNLETIFIEERFKTVSMQNDLAEIKSRLDELSVQRPAYDEEFIKSYVSEILTNTLDTIQDGLVSEKQQRHRLEYMALEIKDIVNKQNENHKLLEEKTKQSENSIKVLEQTRSAVTTNVEKKSTVRPARPTARLPFIRLTTAKPSDGDKHMATSPSPPIVGRVKFSGTPRNQHDNRTAKDCDHIREFGYSNDGVYRVYIKPDSPVLVYCSPETSQMVVQSHRSNLLNFNKNWDEYKHGFGSFDSDFWIGTDILFHIINSSSSETELRMELTNWVFTIHIAHWVTLYTTQLSNEEEGYKLRYSHVAKQLGFYFEDQIPGNGYTFMTKDRQSRGSNCLDIKSGWWYQRSPGCPVTPSNPNSQFTEVTHPRHRSTNYLGYYSYQASRQNKRTTVVATKILLDYRNRN